MVHLRSSFLVAVATALAFGPLYGQSSSLPPAASWGNYIEIHNRILARVNGKPITLIDLVKKMDFVFDRQFAQYSQIPAARYQFYSVNWNKLLEELIDKELILADAEAVKVTIPPAEIRQELEGLFGSNLVAGLEQAGLTHEEAIEMVRHDLTIRKMIQGRVHAKALREVTAQALRQAYRERAQELSHPERWRYQVISFRDKDQLLSEKAAELAHQLLVRDNIPIEQLKASLQKKGIAASTIVNISEEFDQLPSEVADGYRQTLETLTSGQFSPPIAQKSRAAQGLLFRLFYLKERQEPFTESFETVEEKLKQELAEAAIHRHTDLYLAKLRREFNVWEGCSPSHQPAGWTPFVLR